MAIPTNRYFNPKSNAMKSRFFNSTNCIGFEGKFKSLNSNEMINLRGGGEPLPPLPPTGGDDYPIDLPKKVQSVSLLNISIQLIPVL